MSEDVVSVVETVGVETSGVEVSLEAVVSDVVVTVGAVTVEDDGVWPEFCIICKNCCCVTHAVPTQSC